MKEPIKIAFRNIKSRKLRSFLTVIGIIISVCSIIMLIALGNGLERAIVQMFDQMGANRVMLMPDSGPMGGFVGQFDISDLERVERMPEVDYVIPYYARSGLLMEYNNQEIRVMILGLPPERVEFEFIEGYGFDLIEGRFLREGDRNVALMGFNYKSKIFNKEMSEKDTFTLDGHRFIVSGFIEEVGNAQDDAQIYLPIDVVWDLFNDGKKEIMMMNIGIKPGLNLTKSADDIENRLKRNRNDEGYVVNTPEQLLGTFSSILGVLQAVLIAVALISLLVGAVGITNSMYTSVLERTSEIGIMKSIGAKNEDILSIFLAEAGIIGFVGGIIGAVLGTLLAYLIGFIATEAGFKLLVIAVEPYVIFGGILFAVVVGILSGVIPAWQASKLNPVDALRYD
jgi:putative ABC transport system permease protein